MSLPHSTLLRSLFSPLSPTIIPLTLSPSTHLLSTIPPSQNTTLLRYLRRYGPNFTRMVVNGRDLVNWDAMEIAYRLYELMRRDMQRNAAGHAESPESDESGARGQKRHGGAEIPAKVSIEAFKMAHFIEIYEPWCEMQGITPIPHQGKLTIGDLGGGAVLSDEDEEEEVARKRGKKRQRRQSEAQQFDDMVEELPIYNEETYGSLMLGERTDWKRVLRKKRRSKGEYDDNWDVEDEEDEEDTGDSNQETIAERRIREEAEDSRWRKRRKLESDDADKQDDDEAFVPSEDEEF